MTDDEGDAERWDALPSDRDDLPSNNSLVGPVVVAGSSYVHPLGRQGQLVISHRPEQVLNVISVWLLSGIMHKLNGPGAGTQLPDMACSHTTRGACREQSGCLAWLLEGAARSPADAAF